MDTAWDKGKGEHSKERRAPLITKPGNSSKIRMAPASFFLPTSMETNLDMEVWIPAAVNAKQMAVTGAMS